jgi:hypothetical protein
MNVSFLKFKPQLASARLRGYIPEDALRRMGVQQGNDIIVLSKHGWPDEVAEGYKKIVFDVCDDHFSDHFSEHYRKWVAQADLVTCNSQAMADLIWLQCQREATVIPDPYEQPERPPKVGRPPLWFGHRTNFVDVEPLLNDVPDLVCVSNLQHMRVTEWSPGAMGRAYERCRIVLIPTGKSPAKSANRAIDSIRRGMYPCTGRMPAYDDLGLGTDDVLGEMEKRLADPSDTIERIKDLQAMVRTKFSPMTIGKLWKKALESI